MTGLKMHHYCLHEFLVLCVLPSDEVGPEFSTLSDLTTLVLEKREEVSEFE